MLYDIVIVGAGCAGVSAAIYGQSRGLQLLLIESEEVGGLIRKVSTVTHYVGVGENESGPQFAERIMRQLAESGAPVKKERVLSVKAQASAIEIHTDKAAYWTKTVVIASGMEQDELEVSGKPFKKPYISHCALQDWEKYKDRDAFVFGGSDGAAKEALYLSQKVHKVSMVMSEKALTAIAQFSKKIAQTENIVVFTNKIFESALGEEALESVAFRDLESGEITWHQAPGGGIFVYVGGKPNGIKIEGLVYQNGYILTNEKMETNIPGIFAAGDIRYKPVKQIATAVSEGAVAAVQANLFLKDHFKN